jgi:F-type H+-transporting ATPase subunit b
MILQALMLAISEGAEEKAPPVIDIDGTVLVQFAIFVAMFVVLRQFLFKPYMQMRDDRAHRISSAEASAEETQKRATSIEKQVKEKMDKARQTAEDERLKLQHEGRQREDELLAAARDRAQNRIRASREQVTAQVAQAQTDLGKRAEVLSQVLANKLLGREV